MVIPSNTMIGIPIKKLPRSGEWDVEMAYEGDCMTITFVKSGCHTPILHGLAKTITTMCDHDIGVVVYGK